MLFNWVLYYKLIFNIKILKKGYVMKYEIIDFMLLYIFVKNK